MTKFERVGVNHQFDARNADEAKSNFAHSCECCCSQGRHSDCRRCHISYTYSLMIAYFADKEKEI